MKKTNESSWAVACAALLVGVCMSALPVCGADRLSDYVNPFIGATTNTQMARAEHGLGKTFPGAATPWGMTLGTDFMVYSRRRYLIDSYNYIYSLELDEPQILITDPDDIGSYGLSSADSAVFYLDFSEQIEVERFTPRSEGELEARFIHKDGHEEEFEPEYMVFDRHVLVWVVG